jgi:hypothetical protein
MAPSTVEAACRYAKVAAVLIDHMNNSVGSDIPGLCRVRVYLLKAILKKRDPFDELI